MLKLRESNTTVPDKFTWRFPQDGWIASAYDKEDWFRQIDKHYKDNDYPQPDNWREIAENDLCRRLSGEWCEGGGPYSFVNTRFTINDFARGTKVLASFLISGNVVSKEIAEQRAMICSRCPLNVRVPGCKPCSALANVVAEVKGKESTKYDHLLEACAVCKCSNQAAVWVQVEHLAKGVTPEMMETFREIPECWRWKAIDSMDDSAY